MLKARWPWPGKSPQQVRGALFSSDPPFTAEDALELQHSYSLSKMEALQGLRQIAAENVMEVVVIRPPPAFAPDVKPNFSALMRAMQLSLMALHN